MKKIASNLSQWSQTTITWAGRDRLRHAICAMYCALMPGTSLVEMAHVSALHESSSTGKLKQQAWIYLQRCLAAGVKVADMPPVPAFPLPAYYDDRLS